jgi:hypothetical protein
MPFEDILKRSLDTLARELSSAVQFEREEAARQARKMADEAAEASIADAQALAEQRGLTAGREEGLAEGRRLGFQQGRHEGYEAGKSEGYLLGKEAAESEAAQVAKDSSLQAAADPARAERLADAMRAIDRSRSLSEVLDSLAGSAGRETTRAAVLLVHGDRLRGWRFIGFGPGYDAGKGFETTLADAGVIAEALTTRTVLTPQHTASSRAPRFADLALGDDMFAAPIVVGGEPVAVLYADGQPVGQDGATARPAWQPTLEVMTRHAARCLESLTAIRTAQLAVVEGQT